METNRARRPSGEGVDALAGKTDSTAGVQGDLDRLADRMALELLRQTQMRDPARWVGALRRRWGWGFEPESLAAVGDSLGVTRERVRQVMRTVESLPKPELRPLPEPLIEAIELIDWDEPNEVSELLIDCGLSSPESRWSPEGIVNVLRACGRDDLSKELQRRLCEGADERRTAEGGNQAEVKDALKNAIRQARHKSGFLDTRTVRLDGEPVAVDSVVTATKGIYRRVVAAGPWLLCSTQKATMTENAAIVQLKVAGALSGDEIVEGVQRVLRKHNVPAPPPSTVLAALVGARVIRQVDDLYHLDQSAPDVEIVGNDLWLFELLSNQQDCVLPVDEILRHALEDGRNLGSINVHLSFSPFIRKAHGLVHLVGTNLDSDLAEALRRAARARRIPSSINYSVQSDGTELVMVLGTNYIKSGVITIRRDLQALVGDRRRNVACCDAVSFDVRLALDRGTWSGWSSLFNHLVSHHQVREGDTVKFLMTGELVLCQEPWAIKKEVQAVEPIPTPPIPSARKDPPTAQQMRLFDPTLGIRPGDPWPEPRGSRTLVLSIKARALVTPQGSPSGGKTTEETLTRKYGREAAELAERMLAIRPSGGRVWVDKHGRATTLVDGRLTYLGRMPAEWSW